MDEPVRGRVSPDDQQMLKHLGFFQRRQWRRRRALTPAGSMVTTMTGRATIHARILRCRCGDPMRIHATAPCPKGVWENHGTIVDKMVEFSRHAWGQLLASARAARKA